MRSLPYIILGYVCKKKAKPHNESDCIHYSKIKQPLSITCELIQEEPLREVSYVMDYYGKFEWIFPEFNVVYKKFYGCCNEENQNPPKRIIEKLEKNIKKIEDEVNIKIKIR